MNERYFRKVARWCYYPATRAFLELVQQVYKNFIQALDPYL